MGFPFVYAPPAPDSTGPDSGNTSGGNSLVISDFEMPFLYGRREIPGTFIPLNDNNTGLSGIVVFCEGGIDAFESFTVNDIAIEDSTMVLFYTSKLGTSDQASVGGGIGRLPGTAYLYVELANADSAGVPTFKAIARGYKMYDPRLDSTNGGSGSHRLADKTTWEYSNNPPLCLAHFLMDKRVGASIPYALIDWASVTAAADYCDVVLGTGPTAEKRYEFNYFVQSATNVQAIIDLIRIHFLGAIIDDGMFHFLYAHPYDISSPVTFTDADTPAEIWNFSFERPQRQDRYNKIVATWTDPILWESAPYTVPAPGVENAVTSVQQITYDLTGFTRISQAHRVCLFLLNSRLNDLTVKFTCVNDKGIEPGGVAAITHSLGTFGLVSKLMQCSNVDPAQEGTFQIALKEYDPAVYSDEIITQPTFADTDLPKPTDIPAAVTGITLEEKPRKLSDGTWMSIVGISWTESTSPSIKEYRVYYKIGAGAYYFLNNPSKGETYAEIRAAEEGVAYTIKIVAVTRFGMSSVDAISAAITPLGHTEPSVWKTGATLRALVNGDDETDGPSGIVTVSLDWKMGDGSKPAVDALYGDDSDIIGWIVKRGAVTDTAATAPVHLNTSDSMTLEDKTCPSGTWRYFLQARDRGGLVTAPGLELYVDVTNNLNPAAIPEDPATITIAEVPYKSMDGTWNSLLTINWTPSPSTFVKEYKAYYRVTILGVTGGWNFLNNPSRLETYGEIRSAEEGHQYEIKAVAVTIFGIESPGAVISAPFTPVGHSAPPIWKDDAALSAEEQGDIVFVRWMMPDGSKPAKDSLYLDESDIIGWYLKRGKTTDTWEAASIHLDTGDMMSLQDKTCPSGPWRYFLKALDRGGKETGTALYADVSVTLNPYLGFVHDRTLPLVTGATLVNFVAFENGTVMVPLGAAYDTLGERFPGTPLSAGVGGNTYLNSTAPTSALADGLSTLSGATARHTLDVFDLGSQLTGQYALTYSETKVPAANTESTMVPYMAFSNDNSTWGAWQNALTTISGSARYVKVKFEFKTTDATKSLYFTGDIVLNIQIAPKKEVGSAVVLSGQKYVTVTLVQDFSYIEQITPVAQGQIQGSVLIDNIVKVGSRYASFDVYYIDKDGNALGSNTAIAYTVEGN